MYFYRVIPSIRLPYDYLTYCSEIKLSRGQVVTIPIRNKVQFGIISDEESNISFDISKVKHIKSVEPFWLNNHQLKFLQTFAFNTFNKISISSNLFLQPFKVLPLKDIKLIDQNISVSSQKNNELDDSLTPIINYELQNNITFRIRYIIRSMISDKTLSLSQSYIGLFLFPELKLIKKIYQEIIESEPEFKDNIFIYTGTKDKHSKATVNSLLQLKDSSPKIIFGLRSSLFLPFPSLNHIYCIDEGSPYYIQEQNSVYYDARDTVYLLSNAFSCDLTFISSLPSIRLQKMYSENVSDIKSYTEPNMNSNSLKIQITNPQAKFPKNSLFSEDLSSMLNELVSDNEESQYFSLD